MRATTLCLRLIGIPPEFVQIARGAAAPDGIRLEICESLDGMGAQSIRRKDLVIASALEAKALAALPACERILLLSLGVT